jgi:hypothetical protein
LNIVLADAGEIAKAFLTESTRPRGAGLDYLLLPMVANGAFHPKILSLFSDAGMAIAIGSHNLTEAGMGRNAELSTTVGFGETSAPLNIAQPVVDYLLQCAGQLAYGDASLSTRLADRLRSLSIREKAIDEELAFAASEPRSTSLLDQAFQPSELEKADRILVLGPYFDSDLRFLAALRERAPRAEIVVAIQPEHAVMKRTDGWPARTRVCGANALNLPKREVFIHAKAIVLEIGKKLVMALGSANPSGPAWLAKEQRKNFEAMVTLRGSRATLTFRDLGLDQLWKAPAITKKELEKIAARSRAIGDDTKAVGIAPIAGLWKNGWVETQLVSGSKQIRSISRYGGATCVGLPIEAAKIENNTLRFPAPSAGAFSVQLSGKVGSIIVIASSAAVLAPSLVSGATERLIDELGRLDGGAAPGDDLLNLCEKVLLQPEEQDAAGRLGRRPRLTASDVAQSDDELSGPRGISIERKKSTSHTHISLSLDISAIITLLLKDLQLPTKENSDPGVDESEDGENGEESGDADRPRAKPDAEPHRQWDDVVNAIRPRITRLLRQLSNRLDENHSAKWKYERVLLALALLKRLRKFHPGQLLPTTGRPQRLVDDVQVRQAFKMAMRCWFTRDIGIVGVLDRAGGVETEHDVIGRALLLWAAYEAGTDVVEPSSLNVEPDELRAIQCDRTDALIAAIAASASPGVLERARHELFDRGEWHEPRDGLGRLEKWFNRHSQLGLKLQKAISSKRPACLPVTMATPSIRDILVWKAEPGWPRLPQLISGRTIHLSDVGDVAPVRVTQQFVQVVDVKSLGLDAM